MLTNEIKKKENIDFPMPLVDDVNEVVGVPKVVTETDGNGRLVSKVVFEATPIEKMNDCLKVDDFALEVLLQNGYETHRVDYDGSSFENIDRAAAVADSLPRDEKSINTIKKHVKIGK